MSYSFHEHTADIRMNVECRSYPGLFRQALLGMFEFLRPRMTDERVERTVAVRSKDVTGLFVDFLNKALSLAQVHHEAYTSATFKTLSSTMLRAKLSGKRVESLEEDIKAVTYHEANVERSHAGLWRAHVVFDI